MDVVTQILNAVGVILQATDTSDLTDSPARAFIQRQMPADPSISPASGLNAKDPQPCWIFGEVVGEGVDKPGPYHGTFSHRRIQVIVRCDRSSVYVPGQDDEDPNIRIIRTAVMNALYIPGLAGVTPVFGAPGWEAGKPYIQTAGGDRTLRVSTQTATYCWYQPRNSS